MRRDRKMGRMTEDETMMMLDGAGVAIHNGHFRYASGLHGTTYVGKNELYKNEDATSFICMAIAEEFESKAIQVVVGPASGGAILSELTARHLTEINGYPVHSITAEKDGNDSFLIEDEHKRLIPGKRVLVVEDILTTGSSVNKVIRILMDLKGFVFGLGVIWNRAGNRLQVLGGDMKISALISREFPIWIPDNCPLCKQGIPINRELGRGPLS